MQLIDTHTHLYLEEFDSDISEVLSRAANIGVKKFLLPAIDSDAFDRLHHLAAAFPEQCLPMIGLHPCSVKQNFADELALVQQELEKGKYVAIGESGLDFYWDKTFTREQYDSLKMHAEWAIHYDLPLVLHTREAMQETIEVIKLYRGRGLRGVFHCFGGSIHEAREIIENNFMLGIGGVVTFKKSGLAEVLKDVHLEHIVLETDSPYLAPVPYRGKRNESSYLELIASKLAEIKNVAVEKVAGQTTINAERMFKINAA